MLEKAATIWAILICLAGTSQLGRPAFAQASSQAALSAQDADARENELRRLFAEGLKLLKINKAYEAREVLEQASGLEPNDAAIRCNLGLAYQNSGNLERAIAEFNRALTLKPSMPEATLNIAGCYQSMGRAEEAIAWYDKYIRENPHVPEAGQIQDIIKALRSAKDKPGSDPRLPDYYEVITAEGLYRWPYPSLPVRVFIDNGAAVEGYRETFRRTLVEAFDAWVAASHGRLNYVLVGDRNQADVVCDWTSNPQDVSEAGTQSERGMAHIYAKGSEIKRATLKILTTPMLQEGILGDDDMKKACLHEVGHVLGLQGHSTNNHDVMFFTVDTATVWPVLSKRDKATIFKLYIAYPENAHPAPQMVPVR